MYPARRVYRLRPMAGLAPEGRELDHEYSAAEGATVSPPRGLSWQEYRIGARILLHIATFPRMDPGETAPEGLTQSGMARLLGSNRVSVTQALQSLEDGGAVRGVRGHAQNHRRRVKVYRLTPEGEVLVDHIRAGMGGR